MDPDDPQYAWLHAAEMCTLLREAVRTAGSRRSLDLLLISREVIGYLYGDETDSPGLIESLTRLDHAFNEPWDPGQENFGLWNSLTGRPNPDSLVALARAAFHRLLLALADQEGQPVT